MTISTTIRPTTISDELRAVSATWGMAALFPLLILVTIDPAKTGDIACAYLGLASAWMAVEILRGEPLNTVDVWRRKILALVTAVAVNVLIFILFGITANVQTHFPFALMAVLSALPAVGLMPWLVRRVRHPHVAMLWAALMLLLAKLTGCVVARIVYGPGFMEMGAIAGDWRTAKVMLTVFWSISTTLSIAFLVLDYQSCARNEAGK